MKLDRAKDKRRILIGTFRRKEREEVVDQLYDLLENPKYADVQKLLFQIKELAIVPFTDWAYDVHGLGHYACSQVRKGLPLDDEIKMLLDFSDDIPDLQAQNIFGRYEQYVAAGHYPLVKDDVKYLHHLKWLRKHPKFLKDLKRLDDKYNLKSRQNEKGLIVRILFHERNIRPKDFPFDWQREEWRFKTVFTQFCKKWDLYGLEHGEPLLLKVTANPGPFGLMIFFPKWMSIDIARDLIIKEIMKLQKAYRGGRRQGSKLSPGKLEQEERARRVYHASEAAKDKKLEGNERLDFIIDDAGLLPGTSDRIIRRLISQGRKLEEGYVTAAPDYIHPDAPHDEEDEGSKVAALHAGFLSLTPKARELFLRKANREMHESKVTHPAKA